MIIECPQKIEPVNEAVRNRLSSHRSELTCQTLRILREIIPNKIIGFQDLLNVQANPGSHLHCKDLQPHQFSKKVKVEGDEALLVQTHPQILAKLEDVKQEGIELIEMVSSVKLWIQLNVPRIEDGNNFGVGIQEDAIQELARVEDSAFNIYDNICKYFMARAKLTSKVLKYPNIEDYKQAINQLDAKEWLQLKITLMDIRNNYSVVYDLLSKNWEKVVKPKSDAGSNMMTF